jgi:hypothetical protein
MSDPPGYWMHETSGVLRAAVEAYLNQEPLTEDQVSAMRAYFRQWIMADWAPGRLVDELRSAVDGITSRAAITVWLAEAERAGIDPL